MISWTIERDMPGIMEIERSLPDPLTEEELKSLVLRPDVVGQTFHYNYRVQGYAIYQIRPRSMNVIRLAVNPQQRRQLVGTLLLDHLKAKVYANKDRQGLVMTVGERDLAAHLFLKANGFRGKLVGEAIRFTWHKVKETV